MKILGKFPSTRLRRVNSSHWVRRIVSENNLAGDDDHIEVLERMRKELDAWQKETGDLGLIEERVLKNLHYPDGEKPVCREASCLMFTADSYGEDRAPDAFDTFIWYPAELQPLIQAGAELEKPLAELLQERQKDARA